jgi:hypothetical protein
LTNKQTNNCRLAYHLKAIFICRRDEFYFQYVFYRGSRRMRWAGQVARIEEGRNVYRGLVEKPEGKRPLERPRRKWEYGIKMDFREIGWGGGMDSSGSG